MKSSVFIIVALFLTGTGFSQAARSYYDDLYKAGGLDRMADGHVCFEDDPTLKTFFIFGKSDALKEFLMDAGGYAKLPAKEKAALDKGFLTVRQYDNGVPLGEEDTYTKDQSSWVGEIGLISGKVPVRMRFEISWQTLRYKRSVEILNMNHTVKSQVARYGHCEVVSPDIQQKGD